MVLIGIDVHSAVFLEVNKPQPVVLYEIVKGWITGTDPDIGQMHRVHRVAHCGEVLTTSGEGSAKHETVGVRVWNSNALPR
jgi:hypothetical protein